MKNNTDNLSEKVKEACDELIAAGGSGNCSDEDWRVFTDKMDEQQARTSAYLAEMKAEIEKIKKDE